LSLARSSNNPVEWQKKASMKDLLEKAARVCDTHCKVPYDISSKKNSLGEIAMFVPDEFLQNAAMHEGYLAQSNNLLSTGVDFDELLKLEVVICDVEHENGSTYTDLYGDLRMNNDGLSRAAAQKGQNSGLDGAAALSVIAVGKGRGDDDPCAMGSHICDGVERVILPEIWQFPKTPERKSNMEDIHGRHGCPGKDPSNEEDD
jgi:hypothetical protein